MMRQTLPRTLSTKKFTTTYPSCRFHATTIQLSLFMAGLVLLAGKSLSDLFWFMKVFNFVLPWNLKELNDLQKDPPIACSTCMVLILICSILFCIFSLKFKF